jgi:hypothetical protein
MSRKTVLSIIIWHIHGIMGFSYHLIVSFYHEHWCFLSSSYVWENCARDMKAMAMFELCFIFLTLLYNFSPNNKDETFKMKYTAICRKAILVRGYTVIYRQDDVIGFSRPHPHRSSRSRGKYTVKGVYTVNNNIRIICQSHEWWFDYLEFFAILNNDGGQLLLVEERLQIHYTMHLGRDHQNDKF